jgi:hypothetical protein
MLVSRGIFYVEGLFRLSGGLASMDKIVDSFWIALEEENNRWSGFARALRKPDREAFDELICAFRSYASESSNATNPIFFEPMVMSILLFQQRRISKLEAELQELKPDITIPTESQEPNNATQAKPENSDQTTQSGGGQSRLF